MPTRETAVRLDECVDEVHFRGHPLVTARHSSTIEITTDPHLTPGGDCIVGVGASKAASQISPAMKRALRSGAAVRFTLVAPGGEFSFSAWGSKDLSFESSTEMVIRTSDYVDGRTLAVKADSSAREIPRELVRSLRSSESVGVLRMETRS